MKAPPSAAQPHLAGETVTPGRFVCERCGEELEIAEGKVTNLRVCPSCQGDVWPQLDAVGTGGRMAGMQRTAGSSIAAPASRRSG